MLKPAAEIAPFQLTRPVSKYAPPKKIDTDSGAIFLTRFLAPFAYGNYMSVVHGPSSVGRGPSSVVPGLRLFHVIPSPTCVRKSVFLCLIFAGANFAVKNLGPTKARRPRAF